MVQPAPNDEGGQEPTKTITARIRWVDDGTVPLTYANNFLIQPSSDEFILTGAQVVPPVLAGLTAEEAERTVEVPSRVVVRVAIPPAHMPRLIALMQRMYEEWTAERPEPEK